MSSEEWQFLFERNKKIPEIINKKLKRQADLIRIVKDVDEDIRELQAELLANDLKLQALSYENDGPRRTYDETK